MEVNAAHDTFPSVSLGSDFTDKTDGYVIGWNI